MGVISVSWLKTRLADMGESNFQMEVGSHPWFLQLHTYSRKTFMGPWWPSDTYMVLCAPADLATSIIGSSPVYLVYSYAQAILLSWILCPSPLGFVGRLRLAHFSSLPSFLLYFLPSFSPLFMYSLWLQNLRKLKFQIFFKRYRTEGCYFLKTVIK